GSSLPGRTAANATNPPTCVSWPRQWRLREASPPRPSPGPPRSTPWGSSACPKKVLEIDFQNRVVSPTGSRDWLMILCICRGVSEREVVEAGRCGARTLEDGSRRCGGAGGDCGSCLAYIVRHLQGPSEQVHA